jgi:hypothetical protein
MTRNFLCALLVGVVGVGFLLAEEYRGAITAVKDGNVTFQKYKKGEKGKRGEKDGDPLTLPVAASATIAKGKRNNDTKKFEVGDKLEGGLSNEVFTKLGDSGLDVRITTDADNKNITQILTSTRKGNKNN